MKKYIHALVLGFGASGRGAARLLESEGTNVTVLDAGQSPDLESSARAFEGDSLRVCLGAEDVPSGDYDVCIVSPGIPLSSVWMGVVRDMGIPAISELELGWSRCRGHVLAVTGSNGKSTVVKWCGDALKRAGRETRVAGNYGPSLCEVILESPGADEWVVEVSSFQLETVNSFRPDVGILLNVLPNHLDRHGSMETYLETKAKFFARTREDDVCIVPQDLLEPVRELSCGAGRWVTFGSSETADYYYRDGVVMRAGEPLARIEGTLFDNDVMGPSAAAVVAGLEACEVDAGTTVDALHNLDPLPHRMEHVTDLGDVRFIDDSKATNLAAMQAALRMTPGTVRLIAGGLAKEKNLALAKETLADRVSSVYLIGTVAEEMASAWAPTVTVVSCGTLEVAVRRAWDDARAGETILLSPGCASFDQFQSFEDRGQQFADIVKNLAEEEAK